MLQIIKEIALLLFIGGLTLVGSPIFKRLLIIGTLGIVIAITVESKTKNVSYFLVMRKYLIPIGLALLFHGYTLLVQTGNPLQTALYLVFGVVLLLIYGFTIPFCNLK